MCDTQKWYNTDAAVERPWATTQGTRIAKSIEVNIDPVQLCRYLRLYGRKPDAALEARIDAMRAEADAAMRPARVWRRLDDVSALDLRGSATLAKHLLGCHAAYLVCGTIGAPFDALQRRAAARSASDAFILQAIGAAAIEAWMDSVEDEIRGELRAGERLVPRYSPGYGDYPLAAQRDILGILDASRAAGVSLTDALLMVPSKSVSAVIGVGKDGETE